MIAFDSRNIFSLLYPSVFTGIKDGYCGEDGSKPEGTTAAGEATTAMATTTAASTDGKPVKVISLDDSCPVFE